MAYYRKHVFMCINQRDNGKRCCAQAGSEAMVQYAKQKIKSMDMAGESKIRINKAGCMGRCALGPTMAVYPEGVWYRYESEADIDVIIEQHLLGGEVVKHLLI